MWIAQATHTCIGSPAPREMLSTAAPTSRAGEGHSDSGPAVGEQFIDSPLLPPQGSGGPAGAPGERGRTGPLGRKVCLDGGPAGFLRSSLASPPGPLPHSPACPPASFTHPLNFLLVFPTPAFPVESRLGQWDPGPARGNTHSCSVGSCPAVAAALPWPVTAVQHPHGNQRLGPRSTASEPH